jgi:hypothetical protein
METTLSLKPLPLAYLLRVLRADPFILPAGAWALFVVMAWIMRGSQGPNIIAAYLSFALPLLSGILAAYAVLDDPALELILSAPRPAALTIIERLGVILIFQSALALAYQTVTAFIGLNASFLGGILARQLVWFIPSLSLSILGITASFLFVNCTSGAMAVGVVWIVQVMLRGWFITDRWRRMFLLFAGAMAPGQSFLIVNQLALGGISFALLFLAILLFEKQERYL